MTAEKIQSFLFILIPIFIFYLFYFVFIFNLNEFYVKFVSRLTLSTLIPMDENKFFDEISKKYFARYSSGCDAILFRGFDFQNFGQEIFGVSTRKTIGFNPIFGFITFETTEEGLKLNVHLGMFGFEHLFAFIACSVSLFLYFYFQYVQEEWYYFLFLFNFAPVFIYFLVMNYYRKTLKARLSEWLEAMARPDQGEA
jgi:hypothetical protein